MKTRLIFLGILVLGFLIINVGFVNAAVGDSCCIHVTCGTGFYCSNIPATCSTIGGSSHGTCAAGIVCNSGSDEWYCTTPGATCGAKKPDCNSSNNQAPSNNNPNGGSSPIGGGIQNCFKLSQDIKIKNPLDPGDAYITYKENAVLSTESVGADDCKHGAVTTECGDQKPGAFPISGPCYTKNAGIVAMLNIITVVTNWFFYILTILVVFMVIYGGFSYITAAGDPEKAGKGKKILTYAIIGLAIALLAKIVPSVVKFIVGV